MTKRGRVVFVRTRHVYDSYRDFWRLVELSEFETCYVDEMDLAEPVVYITTPINGEHRPHIDNERRRVDAKRAKIVWWNLERPDAPGARNTRAENTDVLRHVDEIWCSDPVFVNYDARMRFVWLGSHPHLVDAPEPDDEPVWDYVTLANRTSRRVEINRELDRTLRRAPDGWGVGRSETLWRTKVLLNVHQHSGTPICEPLRLAVAASHCMAVVTEVSGLTANLPVVSCVYGALVRGVRTLIEDPVKRQQLGNDLFMALCVERAFRRGVEDALEGK